MRHLVILSVGAILVSSGSLAAREHGPEAIVVYVAVDGNDTHPGTANAPVATISRALAVAEKQPAPAEIVVRGGTYFAENTVTVRRSSKTCRLVIRAAEHDTVIVDGSIPLREAAPVAGAPGVYTVRGEFPTDEPPTVWDEGTGQYFAKLAGIESVMATDYSSVILDDQTMAIRCREGLSPSALDIRMSRGGTWTIDGMYGLLIERDHVTVHGIEFRNFVSRRGASAIRIGPNLRGTGRNREGTFARAVVIDSCHASNCYFGFHVNVGSMDARITRCRVRNCITGIWVSGVDTTIEHCEMINDPDWYERAPDSAAYEHTGIRLYNKPEDGDFRHNFIRGFPSGFSSKGSPGRYVFEYNTVIGNRVAVVPDPTFEVRYNIFAGFPTPFQSDGNRGRDAHVDHNIFWGPRDFTTTIQDRTMGGGPNNLFADPLFAAPHLDDYRLLPGSPALGIDGANKAGAFPGVPVGYHAPPRLTATIGRRRDDEIDVKLDVVAEAPVIRTRYRVNDVPADERNFLASDTFALADPDGENRLVLQVQDAHNAWSGEVSLLVRPPARPAKLIGEPEVITSHHGALFLIRADGNLRAAIEYHDGAGWVAAGASTCGDGPSAPLLVTGLEPGKVYPYRLSVPGKVYKGTFTLGGGPRIMYVATAGEDSATAGSREQPFRTLQYALDRAMPGDRIRIMPGVYFGAHRLDSRGGTPENPLIIEGLYPNTVTFDGLHRVGTLLHLENAPHVVLRNLNFRWFNGSGIVAANSQAVNVTQCRFHNQYWQTGSAAMGYALVVVASPNFMVDHCIFTRNRYGLEFRDSPGGRVVHNTAVAGAVTHVLWRGDPVEGTIIKYNSFNWNGNQLVDIRQPANTIRNACVIDLNNYGTTFQQVEGTETPRGTFGPSIERPFPYLPRNREFWRIDLLDEPARAFVNMSDWQAFSGQDQNSFFADPKWVDPRAGRFDVAADSPNLLPDGTIVGALGHLGDKPNMMPEVVLVRPWNGQAVSQGFAIDFEAHASDYDGSVREVRFYAGYTLLGEAISPPYRLTGVVLTPGRYPVTARVTDERGGESVSDEVMLMVGN